jgi:hypothetical protein
MLTSACYGACIRSYAKSTYMSLPRQHKNASSSSSLPLRRLRAGPLWDKNLAFGGASGAWSAPPGWRALAPCGGAACDVLDNAGSIWGALAAGCAPFWAAARDRWRAARADALSDGAVSAFLSAQAGALRASGAVARDRARWHGGGGGAGDDVAYDADVAALRAWAASRARWMDAQLGKPWPDVKRA